MQIVTCDFQACFCSGARAMSRVLWCAVIFQSMHTARCVKPTHSEFNPHIYLYMKMFSVQLITFHATFLWQGHIHSLHTVARHIVCTYKIIFKRERHLFAEPESGKQWIQTEALWVPVRLP